MKALAAALFFAFCLGGPARAAGDAALSAYDAKAVPLDDLSLDLLASNGYEVRDDGKVWDKIGDSAVTIDAMPELLTRLAGARRLKALLQLNAIFNRYDTERHLSDDDREAVRGLVRNAWSVFGPAPRQDFRSYFTPQELEALDKIPPYQAPGLTDMKDPDTSITAGPAAAAGASITAAPAAAPAPAASTAPVVSITAAAPAPAAPDVSTAAAVSITAAPPAASTATAAAAAGAAGAAGVAGAAGAAGVASAADAAAGAAAGVGPGGTAALAPLSAVPSLHRASPFIASAPPPTSAPRAVPVADVKFIPFTAPSGSTSTAVSPKAPDPTAGQFKAWTPPVISTAAAAATAAAVAKSSAAAVAAAPKPAAPAAPPPPKIVAVRAVSADEFAKFVEDGPYTRETKDMFKLIGQRAPEFCLPLLRRTVATTVPQIIVDGRRTGLALRAGIMRDASNPELPPIIALSPGPVFYERSKLFFKPSPREALLLPEAPEAWSELGVAAPTLLAMSGQPPAVPETSGPWGATRAYADGSRRGTYSAQEQAGEMLEQLLLLGLRREGFGASEYAARRWARTAKLLFWAKINDDFGDAFLDPDRRDEFESWLDHPDEVDDVLYATWASAREPVMDPRAGPPADERAFEETQRKSCVRSAIQTALIETSRRRARRVGILEELIDAGLVDAEAAKAAAAAAADAELRERRAFAARPPACPAFDPYRAEALRKSGVLLVEAARAEGVLRSRRAEAGGAHASR